MKAVTLPAATWAEIRALIAVSSDPKAARYCALIAEQVDGSVKVSIPRKGVIHLSAGRGGDLRDCEIGKGKVVK